jgi:shikimate dehydrogenase
MIQGNTRYVAIIGHPVGHTLSPRMHQSAFDHLKLDYCYLVFDIPPRNLKKGVEALKHLGFRGFNVTIPHKETIIPLLDRISPEAKVIGAVNTVLIEDGKLKGFNTDGAGLTESMKREWGFSARNKQMMILGAGGAAKAAATQFSLEGAKTIGIANRTRSKGMALKKRLKKYFPDVEVVVLSFAGPDLRKFLQRTDLLINTTSVGLRADDPCLLPPDFFHRDLKVSDLIYNPPVTPFLKAARRRGCLILNGRGMLLYQGALAFKIWTGKLPPVEVMAKAISFR